MVCGCTIPSSDSALNKTSVSLPDPKTGVYNWADAINNKDLPRLYDLEPDFIRQNVSFDQFAGVNVGNSFISPNSTLTSVEILNETSNATTANLIVVVYWQGPISTNSTKMQTLPIYFKVEEFYEDNEWKVWMEPWQ